MHERRCVERKRTILITKQRNEFALKLWHHHLGAGCCQVEDDAVPFDRRQREGFNKRR